MGTADLRRAYRAGALSEDDLASDPIRLLAAWLDEAVAAGEIEPNAMALASADASGRPSVRFVLLKGVGEAGVTFFTNYESRKARELDATGVAAAAIWWPRLERQARVEGAVERLPAPESEAYFRSRPYGSQIGALASPQSRQLRSREELEAKAAELRARYPEGSVPYPPHWGGYLLRPERLELWQGREDRLHDRFLFTREDGAWRRARLAP